MICVVLTFEYGGMHTGFFSNGTKSHMFDVRPFRWEGGWISRCTLITWLCVRRSLPTPFNGCSLSVIKPMHIQYLLSTIPLTLTSHLIPSWGPITSAYSSTPSFPILVPIKWLRAPIRKVIRGEEGFISVPLSLLGGATELSSTKLFLGFIRCVHRLDLREDHEDIYTVHFVRRHWFTSFKRFSPFGDTDIQYINTSTR